MLPKNPSPSIFVTLNYCLKENSFLHGANWMEKLGPPILFSTTLVGLDHFLLRI